MRLSAFLLLCLPVFAAVDGVVTNLTTGKPQSGVTITLVQPGEGGMETIGTATTDGSGAFKFDKNPKDGAPLLVQATHSGVTYSKMVNPGQPRTGMTVDVFDASAKGEGVAVDRHGILLEPAGDKLAVREFVFVNNKSKITYYDPQGGTYKFWAPAGATIDISLTTQNGMPVKRPAKKTATANVWTVDYPMRPGQTQLEISYETPKTAKFSGNILHKEGETRLISPKGVTLKGAGLEEYAPEPQTQAAIYGVKNGPFTVEITGEPAPRENAAAAQSEGGGGEDSGAPDVAPGRPRIYDRAPWIVGITVAILALGLFQLAGRPSSK